MNERIMQAKSDYKKGLTRAAIAEKYGVSLNTVKSWIYRYKWNDETQPLEENTGSEQRNATIKKPISEQKRRKVRNQIEETLLEQMKENGTTLTPHLDLVQDYLSMWDIKNLLIEDIYQRGAVVEWSNGGKQQGQKKNDSIGELTKINTQMLRLLAELGLNASAVEQLEDDEL